VLFGSGGRSTVYCEAEFNDGKKRGNRADDHEPGVSHRGMFSLCAKQVSSVQKTVSYFSQEACKKD